MDKKWVSFVFIFALAMFFSNVNAQTFGLNGTVYDVNGTALNNTNVSVSLKDQTWTDLGTNSTTTNATGWFNMSLPLSQNYMYQLSIIHTNTTINFVDYVGQTLPTFPYQQFSMLSNTNFYLKEAGTINVTVINSSNLQVPNGQFAVQVKDQKLGYPTGSCSNVRTYEYICYVPRDRNYSIMIYPAQGSQQHFVPVSFDWNNFTATQSYGIGSLSSYNVTTKTLNKQFNVTESMARISGYLNITGISGWEEFTVVPFVSEPGNMIFMTYGILPYNASAWVGSTDVYNLTTGFYNISLPYAASETVNYILFAVAKNGTFYGSYRNITVTGNTQLNFTMYGLLGTNSSINMNLATGGTRVVNTSRQMFQFINTTNHSLSNFNAHIETTVDYSNYGAVEITFMEDLSGSNSGNFSLPMLNVTGFKEMNVYSMNQAPKRVPTRTASQIVANNNITISSFNPGDIEGGITISSITISVYKSNSTCDDPNPPSGCVLTSFTPSSMSNAERNMLPIVMGGGKISIRMTFGGISIHYANVDLLASGPPDGSFDDTTTNSTSGGFSAAMRFGSNGPTIYDYVLVSMPYTEGSSSQTGLNETAPVNMSIPTFYDENWQVIWNTSVNGTNATYLAGNDTHYDRYEVEWGILMGNTTCAANSSTPYFNYSNPCYIDRTNNKIWVRLPHFSGTGPDVDGDVITATVTTTTPSGGGGGGGGGGAAVNKTHKKTQTWTKITPGSATIMKITDSEIGFKQISITVKNPAQTVTITVTKLDGKPATVTHEITGKLYKYIEIDSKNINETNIDKVKIQFEVNKSWINDNDIDPDTVALNRYKNSWEKLQTKKTNEDDGYIYYEAETPGFSTFAITGEVKAGATTTVTVTTTPGFTTTPSATTTIPALIPKIGLIPWIIGILAIIMILAIIGFFLSKKRTVIKS